IYISSTTEGDTEVAALDINDGKTKWTTTIAGSSYFGAALAEDRLIIGSQDGKTLSALSIDDGEELWQFKAGGEGFASLPSVVDDVVYAFSTDFGNKGTLWALRSEEHTSELQSRFDLVC